MTDPSHRLGTSQPGVKPMSVYEHTSTKPYFMLVNDGIAIAQMLIDDAGFVVGEHARAFRLSLAPCHDHQLENWIGQ